MKKISVLDEVFEHLCVFLEVDKNSLPREYDSVLTGPPYYLNGRDLTYFYFSLQERFGITFEEHDVIDYRFSTLKLIADKVEKKT